MCICNIIHVFYIYVCVSKEFFNLDLTILIHSVCVKDWNRIESRLYTACIFFFLFFFNVTLNIGILGSLLLFLCIIKYILNIFPCY